MTAVIYHGGTSTLPGLDTVLLGNGGVQGIYLGLRVQGRVACESHV